MLCFTLLAVNSFGPMSDGRGQRASDKEVAGDFVVARGDATAVLETAEGELDDVALAVGDEVKGRCSPPRRHRGDDRLAAQGGQKGEHVVGVIRLVGNHPAGGGNYRQPGTAADHVVCLAAGQPDGEEAAEAVTERMDLVCRAATRTLDALGAAPLLAPAAERSVRTAELSKMAVSGGLAKTASAASGSCHMPFLLQRLTGLNNVVRGRYASGTAQQRWPSRNRYRTPLITRLWFTQGFPRVSTATARSSAIAGRPAKIALPWVGSSRIQANHTRHNRRNGHGPYGRCQQTGCSSQWPALPKRTGASLVLNSSSIVN